MIPRKRTFCCSTPARFARRRRKRCSASSVGGSVSRRRKRTRSSAWGAAWRVKKARPSRRGRRSWTSCSARRRCIGCRNWWSEREAAGTGAAKPGAVVDVSFPEIEKFDRLPEPRADGPSAFVSVMEGCSKFCTFCVVPYTRGPEVSRPVPSVMRRSGGVGRPRRARDQLPRPERERLPRRVRRRPGGPGGDHSLRGPTSKA